MMTRLITVAIIGFGALFSVVAWQLWVEGASLGHAVRMGLLFAALFGTPALWFLWKEWGRCTAPRSEDQSAARKN